MGVLSPSLLALKSVNSCKKPPSPGSRVASTAVGAPAGGPGRGPGPEVASPAPSPSLNGHRPAGQCRLGRSSMARSRSRCGLGFLAPGSAWCCPRPRATEDTGLRPRAGGCGSWAARSGPAPAPPTHASSRARTCTRTHRHGEPPPTPPPQCRQPGKPAPGPLPVFPRPPSLPQEGAGGTCEAWAWAFGGAGGDWMWGACWQLRAVWFLTRLCGCRSEPHVQTQLPLIPDPTPQVKVRAPRAAGGGAGPAPVSSADRSRAGPEEPREPISVHPLACGRTWKPGPLTAASSLVVQARGALALAPDLPGSLPALLPTPPGASPALSQEGAEGGAEAPWKSQKENLAQPGWLRG